MRETAAVLHQLIDSGDGLLARLAELFDATADRARAYDRDDGDDGDDDAFYLAKGLADAAVRVRQLGEDLHVAPERMASLSRSRRRAATVSRPAATAGAHRAPARARPVATSLWSLLGISRLHCPPHR
ncbi:hypothetical protein O1L60_04170 [Streptomyces diastatochromogenes]|nr:hypothetical protein [Streptomyces diastatochromogenes]